MSLPQAAALLRRFRGVILYLFFGGCTTLVNVASYWALTRAAAMPTLPAAALAWALAVLFAYAANRRWVFGSGAHGAAQVARECAAFFACRAATGAFDMGAMWLCATVLRWNDVAVKAGSNAAVIVLNYVASRMVVFAKKDEVPKK